MEKLGKGKHGLSGRTQYFCYFMQVIVYVNNFFLIMKNRARPDANLSNIHLEPSGSHSSFKVAWNNGFLTSQSTLVSQFSSFGFHLSKLTSNAAFKLIRQAIN